MTSVTTSAHDQFLPNQAVQLLNSHGDHAAGALGRIVGRFARTNPTWLVSFENSLCVEVRGDQIAPSAA